MRIVICGSIEVSHELKEIADKLTEKGHITELPYDTKRIMNGEVSLEDYKKVKQERGDTEFRESAEEDLIIRYYNLIQESDAILVLNIDKKEVRISKQLNLKINLKESKG